ncbi:caspase family protein [uncultured Methylobacterium sp.]|uniref:caspase family protein n=1 Tax=uncultured Methylobacterium sp. TaxID=157278 RepID=UPI0035C97C44
MRLALAAGFGLALAAAAQAAAERRVALVIGNGAYQNVPMLDNPLPDSKAVAASLKRMGFDVVEGYDLRLDAMRTLVGAFAGKLDGAKVALVYYAGHGVSVAGENYLLPTDTVLRNETDLDFRTMNINLVMRQMQREDRVNVLILDACRDNPFAKELARSVRTRSAVVGTGLSEIATNAAAGTMIAFATDPGRTALDGTGGGNSPFTAALLKHIETPGISISAVMDRVRQDVWRTTNEKQRPWVNTSIIGEFYLNPAAAPVTVASADAAAPLPAATPAALQTPQMLEVKLWEAAERSGQSEDYQAYLESHPNGYFAQIARNRLARALATRRSDADAKGEVKGEAKVAATQSDEAGLLLSQKDRIEAQVRLRAVGFDPGGASGNFGPGTRRALTAWQTAQGLPASGFLDPGQRKALWEQSEADYRKLAAVRPPEPKARAVTVQRPAQPRPAPAQAQAQPQRGGGPSLGEMGSFLGGVGSLVGAVRR